MHGVGGGVAVRDQDAALLIKATPIRFVPGVAVHRIKAGSRVGVDIVGLFAKLPGQVHPDQSAGIAGVVRECDLPHRQPFGGQRCRQKLCLRGLAAAIQPLQHDQSALTHTVSPFSAAYFARTSAVFPQHIFPSGQGPLTQAGPALAKIWGATG